MSHINIILYTSCFKLVLIFNPLIIESISELTSLTEFISIYFEKYAFHGSTNAEFALATLGNDAGIYGAAKLVLDEYI